MKIFKETLHLPEDLRDNSGGETQRNIEWGIVECAFFLIALGAAVWLFTGCAIQSSTMYDGQTKVKIWSIIPPMSKAAENSNNWGYVWDAEGSGELSGNAATQGLDMSGQVQTFMGGFAAARGMYSEYQAGKTERTALDGLTIESRIRERMIMDGWTPPPTSTNTTE